MSGKFRWKISSATSRDVVRRLSASFPCTPPCRTCKPKPMRKRISSCTDRQSSSAKARTCRAKSSVTRRCIFSVFVCGTINSPFSNPGAPLSWLLPPQHLVRLLTTVGSARGEMTGRSRFQTTFAPSRWSHPTAWRLSTVACEARCSRCGHSGFFKIAP